MKKLFLLGFAALIITACQKEKQRYFADSAEINTLKAAISAYEAADWTKWRSHFSDTAKIYVNSPDPVTLEERAQAMNAMTEAMASYGFNHDKEYIEMVLDKDDETWVYYWAMHKGTLAANNKELTIPVHLAVQFVDGKIVEEHIYYDGTAMNAEFAALAVAAEEEAELTE